MRKQEQNIPSWFYSKITSIFHRYFDSFKVRMGFGLHIGWGIEGPVGSMQKVDATYLSPHVNMAARCETAAKQWHVQV